MLERFLSVIEIRSNWMIYIFLGFMTFLITVPVILGIAECLSSTKKLNKKQILGLCEKAFILIVIGVVIIGFTSKDRAIVQLKESISLEKVDKTDGILKINNLIKKVTEDNFSEAVYEAELDGKKAIVLTKNIDIKPSADIKKDIYRINFNKQNVDSYYYNNIVFNNNQIMKDLNGTILILDK